MLRQQTLDLIKSALVIVDLDHGLTDTVPMLVPDSRQNFSLTLLDIHLQKIDPGHAFLIDDFRECPQAAGKRHLPELEAEQPIGILRREAAVDHECLRGAAIGFQIGVESRHHRVGGVKGEFRSTRRARQSALIDSGIGAMELYVAPEALASRRAGFERKDADVAAFPMKEYCCQPDVGPDVEYAIPIAQLDSVLQIAPRHEHFAVHEARLDRKSTR